MERDEFNTRLEAKRVNGLVDVKFFVKHGEALSKADFFAASNSIDKAIENGRCTRTREWQSDQGKKKSHLLAE